MRKKASLHRVGDIALKISIGAAMLGLGIWLFAPDSWFSSKTAAAIAGSSSMGSPGCSLISRAAAIQIQTEKLPPRRIDVVAPAP
jgi:hypothetical protein